MKTIIEYHGITEATGIKHFEVYRTKDIPGRTRRYVPRGSTWRLMRMMPAPHGGGVESFETAELAMIWGSKLNPTVEWRKITRIDTSVSHPLTDPEKALCACAHPLFQHKTQRSGAVACCHFGCGCANFEGGK